MVIQNGGDDVRCNRSLNTSHTATTPPSHDKCNPELQNLTKYKYKYKYNVIQRLGCKVVFSKLSILILLTGSYAGVNQSCDKKQQSLKTLDQTEM